MINDNIIIKLNHFFINISYFKNSFQNELAQSTLFLYLVLFISERTQLYGVYVNQTNSDIADRHGHFKWPITEQLQLLSSSGLLTLLGAIG